jgi:ribonuclease BN (tRNA processing enzyme)
MGDPRRGEDWRQSVRTIFGPPYWPVSIARAGAEVSFEDIPWDAGFLEVAGARICWCPVWHPQQCLAYRIATPRRSIVIATDREPGNPAGDSAFLDFCRGAQVLIYDAQYTPEEYSAHRGWGHGTWRDGVEVARASGIEELILTHHDRQRTDNELDRILAAAREAFPRVRMAACDFEIRA